MGHGRVFQLNESKHKARIKEWLGKKHIKVFESPSQSPNLNPIEKLWRELKLPTCSATAPKPNKFREDLWGKDWAKIPVVCTNLQEKSYFCNGKQRFLY